LRETIAHANPAANRNNDGSTLRLDTNTEGSSSGSGHTNTDTNRKNKYENKNPESPITSPVTSPPYWSARSSQDHPPGHARTVSSASADSLTAPRLGITLRDNENSSVDDRGSACWARSVQVTDYVVVNGGATNFGAFVVWNIRVETLTVSA
jgi:hypothetical protein